MRSRLTPSNPAARAQPTTCGTRSGSCVRSRVASTCGTADCMPNDTRVKPASRSRSRSARSTLSGLASVVTSASGRTPSSSRTAPSSRARSAGGSRVGVPPPRKTVAAGDVGVAEHPAGQPHLRDRRPGVRGLRGPAAELGRGVGVEVAVAAAGGAEGHVDVHPERTRAEAGAAPTRAAPRRAGRPPPRAARTARRSFSRGARERGGSALGSTSRRAGRGTCPPRPCASP